MADNQRILQMITVAWNIYKISFVDDYIRHHALLHYVEHLNADDRSYCYCGLCLCFYSSLRFVIGLV